MSPWKYAWFTGFYVVMQFFNKQGARILSLWDKDRRYNKNSWDKWPTRIGQRGHGVTGARSGGGSGSSSN